MGLDNRHLDLGKERRVLSFPNRSCILSLANRPKFDLLTRPIKVGALAEANIDLQGKDYHLGLGT